MRKRELLRVLLLHGRTDLVTGGGKFLGVTSVVFLEAVRKGSRASHRAGLHRVDFSQEARTVMNCAQPGQPMRDASSPKPSGEAVEIREAWHAAAVPNQTNIEQLPRVQM